MALNTEERFNLLQQYHENTNYNIRQSIVHKFVRDAFPSDDEYNQVSNYIKFMKKIDELYKEILKNTRSFAIGDEYIVLDVIKYF